VSRRHAEIVATPRGYMLVDYSTNGAWVNGERVQNQRLLARADIIRVGEEEFRFYADLAPAAPLPPPPQAVPPVPPPAAPPPYPDAHAVAQLADTGFTPSPAPPAPRAWVPPPAPVPPPPVAPVKRPPPPAPPAQPASQAAPVPSPLFPPAAAVPSALAKFVVRSGPRKGERVLVKVPIVNIGRADYNDIVLDDASVSSQHAKLTRREGLWILVDLGSTNGTMVDGERIEEDTPLAPGCFVRFGDVQLIFEPTDDAAGVQAPKATRAMQAIKLPPPPRPPE
jgi:pSer/pThr/pTyr-binding forkhead associated (FHA) protein